MPPESSGDLKDFGIACIHPQTQDPLACLYQSCIKATLSSTRQWTKPLCLSRPAMYVIGLLVAENNVEVGPRLPRSSLRNSRTLQINIY